MHHQKGQIQIIILVLLFVGFIMYVNFFGFDIIDKWFKGYKITPPSGKTELSAPSSAIPAAPAPVILDAVPPIRFNVQPTGVLPLETRKIPLSLETDEKAICRYSDIAGVSYDSMQGKFSQTNSISHSVLITALSEGGEYQYYIKCIDEAGNKNIDDLAAVFSVAMPKDKIPPILSNPSHKGDVFPAGTTSVAITISTNEPASCRYSTVGGVPYNSMSGKFSYYDQTQRFHVKQITGLANGGNYDFFARCQDSAGNVSTGDVLISFTVAQ